MNQQMTSPREAGFTILELVVVLLCVVVLVGVIITLVS